MTKQQILSAEFARFELDAKIAAAFGYDFAPVYEDMKSYNNDNFSFEEEGFEKFLDANTVRFEFRNGVAYSSLNEGGDWYAEDTDIGDEETAEMLAKMAAAGINFDKVKVE